MGSRVMSCSCYRTNVRITLQAGLHQIVLMNVTIQLKIASGGPAGVQTFKKFDKQVLRKPSRLRRNNFDIFAPALEKFIAELFFKKATRRRHS